MFKKRFLCLYLFLFPYIDLLLICYACLLDILPGANILPKGFLPFIWPLCFLLFLASCVSSIVVSIVIGSSYAAGMSLIEASIWNLLIKIFYLCIQICLILMSAKTLDYLFGIPYSIFLVVLIWWIPPLFSICFLAVSSAFSVIIYSASCEKGIWPIGIVILFDLLSFILGIDLVIAIIHLYKCCMVEKKQKL